MRTIRRLIEAKKIEREENGEAGFSLIELIIVVVILGILVAVAIPLIGNLQKTAIENATEAAASNAATQVAAQIAQAATPTAATIPDDNDEFEFAFEGAAPKTLDEVCVIATSKSDATVKAAAGSKTGCAVPAS